MWVNMNEEVRDPHFVRLQPMPMKRTGYQKSGKYLAHFTKKAARKVSD